MPFLSGVVVERTNPVPSFMKMTVAKVISLVTILCVDGSKFLHESPLSRQKVSMRRRPCLPASNRRLQIINGVANGA
jgi:hypothetical protein